MVELCGTQCTIDGVAGNTFAAALQFFAASQCLLKETWPPQANIRSKIYRLLKAADTSYLFEFTVQNESRFDFIVVGGGTAGLVLATRLSEIPEATVLLIEAGPDPPYESIIPGFKDVLKGSQYDWNFTTVDNGVSSQSLQGGSQRQPRGKMLGGSGSLNDMIYSRGVPADYDEWAAIVGNEWAWDNVLKYFKKTEYLTDERIINDPELRELHGHSGEIEVSGFNESIYSTDKFLEAFEELGFNRVKDMTSPDFMGVGRFSHTIRDGRRDSSLTALLNKASSRSNLFVLKNAVVSEIVIKRNIARGVKVIANGTESHYYAKREIVVSAGTFNTAKLLLLSGIGPRNHLEALGIKVVADLPVGDNFHDHIMVLTYLAADNGTCYSSQADGYMETVKYLYNRRGKLSLASDLVAYISLNPDTKNVPDYAIYPTCMPINSNIYNGCLTILGFRHEICAKLEQENKQRELLTLAVVNLKPKSRGKVRLSSKDPSDDPLIFSGTFSDLDDLAGYPEAMKIGWSIANTSYFKAKNAYVVDLDIEGCEGLADAELMKCRAKSMAMSAWHAVGTAAMGTVVDSKLKVKGVKKLRVVDASVMMKVIRGNTNAPVVMIAEMAADFIKDDY